MSSLYAAQPADCISPLSTQGLTGRIMKYVNPDRNRQILFIYGQHSSLERWWGLVQELGNYGTVTVPDMPGYGGMDSLYTIGHEPTFDALADYLATFIREQYQPRKFSLIGLSIGFPIVTRMLERHPDLIERVELLVSVVGFAHHDDFIFSKTRQRLYSLGSQFFLHRPLDLILKHIIFNPSIMKRVYHRSFNAKEKFAGKSEGEFQATMDMELQLWAVNDLRTWMCSNIEMFKLNNCRATINLPVLHLSVRKDRYFDLKRVELHYRQIFSGYTHIQLNTDSHGPSVIATAAEAAVLIPQELRALLSEKGIAVPLLTMTS